MNASQIHLALTHLPVILSLTGLVMLAISFMKTNLSLRRTALYILLVAGLAALPVYFSGEGAEEAVEHLPGVSETLIEEHEDIAKISLFAIIIAALLSVVTLLRFLSTPFAKNMAIVVLLVSAIAGGLLVQTAHLGGQIRHSEIRQASNWNNEAPENSEKESDKD